MAGDYCGAVRRGIAEKTPWVHLDIAGTARLDSAKGY